MAPLLQGRGDDRQANSAVDGALYYHHRVVHLVGMCIYLRNPIRAGDCGHCCLVCCYGVHGIFVQAGLHTLWLFCAVDAVAGICIRCVPIITNSSLPLRNAHTPTTLTSTVLCSLFLLCTVPAYAFVYYAIFVGILLAIYSLFGIHNASSREGGGYVVLIWTVGRGYTHNSVYHRFAAVASKEEFDEEEEGVTEDDDEMLPAGVVRSTTTTTTTARV